MMDIQLTSDLELAFAAGDLVIDDNLKQAQQLLLGTNKGEWKQNPKAGVGVVNFIESAATGELSREIREQYSRDGMRVNSVKISNSQRNVDAQWKS